MCMLLGQYLLQVYVRSTDVDRTIMTAQSLLTGLYPSNFSDWELGTWQPIPVHMESGNSDQVWCNIFKFKVK